MAKTIDIRNYLTNAFYGVDDMPEFFKGLRQALSLVAYGGAFTGDNLITFQKNLSFLRDDKFMNAFDGQITGEGEQALAWRIYTLCWAGERVMRLEGDFVECGSYRGTSSRIMAEYLDFANSEKNFYMYDLFDHTDDMPHHAMQDHGTELFGQVKARFTEYPNVHVTQGKVPDILELNSPEKIAFLHIDMNNAEAEVGALEALFDRVVPGGSIILDDYGWLVYQAQKDAEDPFFAELGYKVLEMPTGQGLVIK